MRNMKTKCATLIAILLASASLAWAADSLTEALQKGLFEEEANHNLDAAIQAYQSVINQSQDQRKVTATALFRLGECYRKQNKTNEAVAQYQQLLRDYSDQTTLVTLSRQNLVGLGVGTPTAVAVGEQVPPTNLEAEEIQKIRT